MVGALVEGLQFSNGDYTGGTFGWLTAFSALCGIGLCFGYSLLGACWLVRKSDGPVRDAARRQIPPLAIGVLVFLVVVFAYALAEHLPILQRWTDRPYLLVFPAIGAGAAAMLAKSILVHDDYWPFHMVALIFVAAFATLALSFWPYMIPFVVTIDEAAAPHASLALHVLGRRPVRISADGALCRRRISRLPRQGGACGRSLLTAARSKLQRAAMDEKKGAGFGAFLVQAPLSEVWFRIWA
ncbi:cytochrome bd-type quinol oxidase subunit 2 [Bradyrhizobium sp. LM6.10]